jgi:aspartate/methionine/tyrosine aminotransferase
MVICPFQRIMAVNPTTPTNQSITTLQNRSEERKKRLRAVLKQSQRRFPGTINQSYLGIIDAYHGETGFPLDPNAEVALQLAWNELLHKNTPLEYSDGKLYDKRQPLILRQLAAETLFASLSKPAKSEMGVQVKPNEVLVCPYSSTILLEEAVATLARPGGVIVCPEGFYKSAGAHISKCGLKIVPCPAVPGNSFKIDAQTLAEYVRRFSLTGELCGILLTMPGNPVIAEYSLTELKHIGTVLADSGVPIICDMAFDKIVQEHIPLASLCVPSKSGTVRMYDKMLTITGNSKAYNAFGPCKLGAACSGNIEWLERINARLNVPFQRETTHLVRAVLAHTSEAYFERNRDLMHRQLERARNHLARINNRFGTTTLQSLGSPQGMFFTIVFDRALLNTAGLYTSSDIEDELLSVAGIDSVALDRTGSSRLGIRLNVLAPRKRAGREDADLIDELFDRIEKFIEDLKV